MASLKRREVMVSPFLLGEEDEGWTVGVNDLARKRVPASTSVFSDLLSEAGADSLQRPT